MVAVNMVGRFLHQNDLHTYRRKLAHDIRQQILFRLLPALIDLPLEIVAPDGSQYSLNGALHAGRHISLSGASGSGRRLALLQAALRWAEGSLADTPPPVLVNLQQLDDGATDPDDLLAAAALAALRPAEPTRLREPLAFLRRMVGDDDQPSHQHMLLIHGWDELLPERQAIWRAGLQAIAESDSTTQLLVALPLGEQPWPGFTPLATAAISPALCASWIEHLAPAEFRAQIATALIEGGSLHPLSDRLFDIALLAWLTPIAGLAGSRAELYAQALATILGVTIDQLDQARGVAELQLLAAYDEQPPEINSYLIERDLLGRAHFMHPQARRFLAARQLLAEQRYDLLGTLNDAACAELAPLIATMLDDSTPLYAALWPKARRHVATMLTLARCVRERQPRNPTWTLRIVAALAHQSRHGDPAARPQSIQLLGSCMPAFDACLPLAARADQRVQRFLLELFALMPPDLAMPRIQHLILTAETPEPFAWQLADRLLAYGAVEQPMIAPPRFNPQAMACWIYIQTQQDAAGCRQIDPATVVAALHALADSGAGESRKLFVASALVENPAQPDATRLAALELLSGNSQPPAHTVVERACGDANLDIRRKALELLSQLDPARAAVALGRTAMDGSAGWELRLAAIRHLGETWPPGAERLLLHCSQDAALPLYARLKAVAALAGNHSGIDELISMLSNTHQHPVIRSAAAWAIGAAKYGPSLPELIQLIDAPDTPSILAEGGCRGLGALRDRAAVGSLARLLGRSATDVPLTLAVLHALGQIGDPDATAAISPLLGQEALLRLQRTVEHAWLDRPVDDCLNEAAVPPAIADRLALALASSPTEEARPTTLSEFLVGEADRIRAAAARALATIGGNPSRAALLAALLDETTGGATADIITALSDLEGDQSADSLGYLLNTPEVNPLTHWLVARHLITHPAGEAVMLRALQNTAIDSFTRGALAEGLGQRHASSALTPLRHLAENRQIDPYLRSQALLGLGLLDDPTTETILTRLIGDVNEDLTLRGLAAEYLPQQLSTEGRRFLRDLLRAERTPAQLVIGALRTLGRVRDREALPLLLRYCLGETTEIAQAAIDALADLGDGSVAPVLVRISQQHGADHALRLQAVSALLRIGGDGYLPLLRAYLHQGALPFRMLALEALLGSRATAADLLPILSNQSWPTAMRLRLLDYFTSDTAATPALISLLEMANDEPQLRILAAEALGRLHSADAAPALIRQAEHADTPAALRLRCVATLQKLNVTASWAVLSQLAEDPDQPTMLRERAQRALCDVVTA